MPVPDLIDDIGLLNGVQPVGDHNHRASADDGLDGRLDLPFALAVEGACRLIKENETRLAEKGACDRDALSLPAGQILTALQDRAEQPLRMGGDKLQKADAGITTA